MVSVALFCLMLAAGPVSAAATAFCGLDTTAAIFQALLLEEAETAHPGFKRVKDVYVAKFNVSNSLAVSLGLEGEGVAPVVRTVAALLRKLKSTCSAPCPLPKTTTQDTLGSMPTEDVSLKEHLVTEPLQAVDVGLHGVLGASITLNVVLTLVVAGLTWKLSCRVTVVPEKSTVVTVEAGNTMSSSVAGTLDSFFTIVPRGQDSVVSELLDMDDLARRLAELRD